MTDSAMQFFLTVPSAITAKRSNLALFKSFVRNKQLSTALSMTYQTRFLLWYFNRYISKTYEVIPALHTDNATQQTSSVQMFLSVLEQLFNLQGSDRCSLCGAWEYLHTSKTC